MFDPTGAACRDEVCDRDPISDWRRLHVDSDLACGSKRSQVTKSVSVGLHIQIRGGDSPDGGGGIRRDGAEAAAVDKKPLRVFRGARCGDEDGIEAQVGLIGSVLDVGIDHFADAECA
ncbi:hypothetical protein [Glaciibacter superstes]|uniref:hypothetical protein n=1 Tax=Glaciibacter superstes TaxID=501023 RepID=UPI0012F72D9D|nr:hypothetical protein [Glaciibacter superstes]